MKGWMYILECANGLYYTGSTNNLELRLEQHQRGEGANFTRKNLPVKLVYFEEFPRVELAFHREKQVQGWSRKKKEALIQGFKERLHELAACKNETHFRNAPFDSAQGTLSGSAHPSAPLRVPHLRLSELAERSRSKRSPQASGAPKQAEPPSKRSPQASGAPKQAQAKQAESKRSTRLDGN